MYAVFCCFSLRVKKKLIRKLEEKVLEQKGAIKLARKESKTSAAKIAALEAEAQKEPEPTKSFVHYIDEAIDKTRDHHKSLNPDRDIVLDITPDSPMERQVASLRHAFLLAEKEACFCR